MSTKSGPNGQALLTCLKDFTLLPNQLIGDLILLGGEKLKIYLDKLSLEIFPGLTLTKFIQDTFLGNSRRNSIRRLSYFSDKEGKSRVIAIVDY